MVANACSDDTILFLQAYQEKRSVERTLPLTWFEEPSLGKTNALNSAIPHLSGSIIAFVDDDHRVDPGFLSAVSRTAVQLPNADMFCGRILPDWDGTEPSWVHEQGEYKIFPLPVPNFNLGNQAIEITLGGPIPGGGNLFVRRSVFDINGKFSKELGPSGHNLEGSEDYEWITKALKKKIKMVYSPDVVQYHFVDKNRLKMNYLIQKAFIRSKTMCMLSYNTLKSNGIPKFIFRKLITRFVNCILFSYDHSKRRFYLVRLAATCGEFAAYLNLQKQKKSRKAECRL